MERWGRILGHVPLRALLEGDVGLNLSPSVRTTCWMPRAHTTWPYARRSTRHPWANLLPRRRRGLLRPDAGRHDRPAFGRDTRLLQNVCARARFELDAAACKREAQGRNRWQRDDGTQRGHPSPLAA